MDDCGGGKVKRVSVVFPITPIRPSSDAQYGVSAGVSGMTVASVADVASSGR